MEETLILLTLNLQSNRHSACIGHSVIFSSIFLQNSELDLLDRDTMLHVVLTSHFYELLLCLIVGFALVRALLSDHPFYSVFGGSIRMLTRAVTAERLPSLEDGVTVATGVNVSLHLRDKLDIESLSWASTF
jgi:hypothetical protein